MRIFSFPATERTLRITQTILAIAGLIVGVIAVALSAMWATRTDGVAPEIKGWAWGSYPKLCGPVALVPGPSLTKAQRAAVWPAARHVQRQIARPLYRPLQGPHDYPRIVVHSRHPPHVTNDGLCQRGSLLGVFGRTYRTPEWGPTIRQYDIVVCFDLIDQAKRWQMATVGAKTEQVIKRVAQLGYVGHIAHELLHPYLGDRIGHSHPKHQAGLMGSPPVGLQIGPVVKGVFARHIDPYCKNQETNP